ncbi:hypothetical protein P168DRAFT_322756 [Aspergillus campestris IBT 28561]|uniref:Uncharacterized protein n=1 Tax=Aspergillus campestris (strain IBT 28561) TaxID=1392248 RepID=A0A2I1CQU6_ASPC2|nr:uncharacterized protein P168DRAFT_322756 [Aspergillus campestris IBT 28561]PKX99999.1 hypothetical protein P168DRAFT_322756 [Aspergillus campestris IBT 28561]
MKMGKSMLRLSTETGGMDNKTEVLDRALLSWRLHDMDHVERTLAETTRISVQRIPARYVFSELDAAERCTHAEIKEILRPRLQLLFQGHYQAIGFDLVAEVAKRGPKKGQA